MDPISLALSVASLASLFQTAVDCFEYVQISKSLGTDLQTSVLQLDNAQLRLSRWGTAVGLDATPTDAVSLQHTRVSPPDVKRAEALLNQIIALFQKAESVAAKYRQPGEMHDVVESGESLERSARSLHERMRQICSKRRGGASRATKAKWALYGREHLERLVRDVQQLTTDLSELFPAPKPQVDELCDGEAVELSDDATLPILKGIAAECDKPLEEALARLSSRDARANRITWYNYGNTKVMNQIGGDQNVYGDQNISF